MDPVFGHFFCSGGQISKDSSFGRIVFSSFLLRVKAFGFFLTRRVCNNIKKNQNNQTVNNYEVVSQVEPAN